MLVTIILCGLFCIQQLSAALIYNKHCDQGPWWCFGGCASCWDVPVATDLCTFQDIVLWEDAPTCAPKVISKYVENYDPNEFYKDIGIQVATIGLTAFAGTGPGQNVAAMIGTQILQQALGEEEPVPLTENDLTAQYNELVNCMDTRISQAVAGTYNTAWMDYANQYYDILDEMIKETSTSDEIKGLLKTLESTIVKSYSLWEKSEYYTNYLYVGELAPTFAIALNTVYLTSTTYLGFLYDDGDCAKYSETLDDLKIALTKYEQWILYAGDTFNAYYKPSQCITFSPYIMVPWNSGQSVQQPYNSYCGPTECGVFTEIMEQYDEFYYSIIGNLTDSTKAMLIEVNDMPNIC